MMYSWFGFGNCNNYPSILCILKTNYRQKFSKDNFPNINYHLENVHSNIVCSLNLQLNIHCMDFRTFDKYCLRLKITLNCTTNNIDQWPRSQKCNSNRKFQKCTSHKDTCMMHKTLLLCKLKKDKYLNITYSKLNINKDLCIQSNKLKFIGMKSMMQNNYHKSMW